MVGQGAEEDIRAMVHTFSFPHRISSALSRPISAGTLVKRQPPRLLQRGHFTGFHLGGEGRGGGGRGERIDGIALRLRGVQNIQSYTRPCDSIGMFVTAAAASWDTRTALEGSSLRAAPNHCHSWDILLQPALLLWLWW